MKSIINQFKLITLTIWDKLFLIIFTIIVGLLFTKGMTIITFGGIVLIYGAFLTYKGQVLLSVGSYLFADLCWLSNAFMRDDIQGVIFISIGIIFGLLATWKMSSGHYEKDVLKKN